MDIATCPSTSVKPLKIKITISTTFYIKPKFVSDLEALHGFLSDLFHSFLTDIHEIRFIAKSYLHSFSYNKEF